MSLSLSFSHSLRVVIEEKRRVSIELQSKWSLKSKDNQSPC